MAENRLAFGKKIRRAREEQGLSLREFARIVDIGYSNLSRIERGERPPPDLNVVIEIAKELEIDKNDLLRLAGVPQEVIENRTSNEIINWVSGRVVGKSGDLTEIEAGEWTLHVVEEPSSVEVMLGLRPADVTLFLSDSGFAGSSARNRIKGTVKGVKDCENYNLAELDCRSFSLDVAITDTSLKKMELKPDKEVYATFKATAPVLRSNSS
ncbi:helix-turn-helix domain-containing protein [Candidatus Bipolaricaulota bacterium]|nr:helix-turn-helix domain-containing protein [Candidatus Bipolaricaulota bacterium]